MDIQHSVLKRCARCGGLTFPAEDGERSCLMCGERIYDWQGVYIDRLLDAMDRRALKDSIKLGPVILNEVKDPWLRRRGTDPKRAKRS